MIIYFFIVLVGSLIAGKLIMGELRKERRDYVVLIDPSEIAQEAKQTKQTEEVPRVEEPVLNAAPADFISPAAYTPFVKIEPEGIRLENWERIIAQKNAEIAELTKKLEAQIDQTEEFGKIKALLERQIFESRQMNRTIKKELDALMAQGQKSQDEILKLQRDLNYKEQLIHQSETRVRELKNRIAKILPNTPATAQEPEKKEEPDLGDFSFDQLDWRKKLTE
jgi:hypothetical protein